MQIDFLPPVWFRLTPWVDPELVVGNNGHETDGGLANHKMIHDTIGIGLKGQDVTLLYSRKTCSEGFPHSIDLDPIHRANCNRHHLLGGGAHVEISSNSWNSKQCKNRASTWTFLIGLKLFGHCLDGCIGFQIGFQPKKKISFSVPIATQRILVCASNNPGTVTMMTMRIFSVLALFSGCLTFATRLSIDLYGNKEVCVIHLYLNQSNILKNSTPSLGMYHGIYECTHDSECSIFSIPYHRTS